MMRKMSERQQKILEFVMEYTADHGYPPSIREIGQAVGISSTSVVDYNLRALERSGLIRRDREVSRGLGVVGQTPTARRLAEHSHSDIFGTSRSLTGGCLR